MLIGAGAGTAGSLHSTLIGKRSINPQPRCHPGPTAALVPLACSGVTGARELLGRPVRLPLAGLRGWGLAWLGRSLLGLWGNPGLRCGQVLNTARYSLSASWRNKTSQDTSILSVPWWVPRPECPHLSQLR